jgi:hypothetical protein
MWCTIAARDQYQQENIWWSFCHAETTRVYTQMREDITKLGYTIVSVTGDGFGGIRQAFNGIPFQMCHVHMERLVIKGTTRKPKLEASAVLLALIKTLPYANSNEFRNRFKQFIIKYDSFINEKTYNFHTGSSDWTHEPLRGAVHSLVNFLPFLFTYEYDKSIPKTTNSTEGHFRHIKEILAIHCGLRRHHKERVIHTILLAGSIAPKDDVLDKIL